MPRLHQFSSMGVSGPFPTEAVATHTNIRSVRLYVSEHKRGGSPCVVPSELWLCWGTGIHEWSRTLISVRSYTWVGPTPLSTRVYYLWQVPPPPNQQCFPKIGCFFSSMYSGWNSKMCKPSLLYFFKSGFIRMILFLHSWLPLVKSELKYTLQLYSPLYFRTISPTGNPKQI